MAIRKRWYNGLTHAHKLKAFTSETVPTERTHGARFLACVGPFYTRRGAVWAAAHALGNPHAVTVAQCEKLAKAGV